MGIKLDTQHIQELGSEISSLLNKCGVTTLSTLTINVSKNDLRKIDEDLFYRREHSKDEKFKPSDEQLTVVFDGLKIIIRHEPTKDSNIQLHNRLL